MGAISFVFTMLVGAVGIKLTLLGLVLLAFLALMVLPAATLERRRLRLIEPCPVRSGHRLPCSPGLMAWLATRLRERATWREALYIVLLAFVLWPLDALIVGGVMVVIGGLLLASYCALALPSSKPTLFSMPLTGPAGALIGLLSAAAITFAGAYLVTVVAMGQARVARWLIGGSEPDASASIAAVEVATTSERVIGAFDAERRRIERDLHDRVQQSLVTLAMRLSLARMEAGDSDGGMSGLVAAAHDDAVRALADLRDVVRGIHPQVLADRGLGYAVIELAERLPLVSRVEVSVPRMRAAVENAAYAVVCEALTNVVKHSGAERVWVRGWHSDGVLTLEIKDDGIGGAVMSGGGGLRGLADRLAAVRGTLQVSSPAGGPTTLRATIPCDAEKAVEDSGQSAV